MRTKTPARLSWGPSRVLMAVDAGMRLHHFRLGVKGGEINVLDRNIDAPANCSMTLSARIASAVAIVLGVAILPWLSTSAAAQSASGAESPLALCWKQASSRVALAPCLERLLADAKSRLSIVRARVEADAAELDRVTGYRTKNVARTRTSEARWQAYRDAECARQAEAMSPGTGSGDVYLACQITLTNEREKQLSSH